MKKQEGTKVLVYGNRKQNDMLWDVSTPEKEDAAFRALFKYLDEIWLVYTDLRNPHTPVICEACSKDYCKGCSNISDCACTKKECPSNADHNAYEKTVRLHWIEDYKKAKAGDVKYMRKLMCSRNSRGYEYEEFHFAQVKDATA